MEFENIYAISFAICSSDDKARYGTLTYDQLLDVVVPDDKDRPFDVEAANIVLDALLTMRRQGLLDKPL